MGSGGTRQEVGSVKGTGAEISIRTVGFRPKTVEIYNVASDDSAKWIQGMADASAIKSVKAGANSLITTLGITPLSDGFKIGADTDLNVDGELVRWVANE